MSGTRHNTENISSSGQEGSGRQQPHREDLHNAPGYSDEVAEEEHEFMDRVESELPGDNNESTGQKLKKSAGLEGSSESSGVSGMGQKASSGISGMGQKASSGVSGMGQKAGSTLENMKNKAKDALNMK